MTESGEVVLKNSKHCIMEKISIWLGKNFYDACNN